MVEEEVVVVEEEEGLEVIQGMALCLRSMMMEGMIGIGATAGAGVEAGVGTSVGVEEEGMVVLWTLSKMLVATSKKHLFRAEAVDVAGDLVAGDVDSDLMDRQSMLLRRWSNLEATQRLCSMSACSVFNVFLSFVRINFRLF